MTADFRIDPAFKKLIAPLSEDERAQLEANLVAAGGARDPLVVWDGLLLDGHNRAEICTRLGLRYRVVPIQLADRLAAQIWIRWNQLGRRNLTDDQRAMVSAFLLADLATQSKRERAQAGRQRGGKATPAQHADRLSDTVTDKRSAKPKTDHRRAISKRSRVSERKVKKAAAIKKRDPVLADKVAAGDVSLAEAVRATKPAIRAERLAAAVWPDGKFGVILADPPWKPDDGLLDPTRRIENQYPTLALAELVALRDKIDAIAANDAVLLLWTTTQKLNEATAVIEAWGFVVKSGAVWIKNSIGMGYWFRARHELLILATRGNPMTPLEADRPDSVITAPRAGHSEKPAEVYALIERMFPTIPKVEVFARATRDGWQRVTNETELRSA